MDCVPGAPVAAATRCCAALREENSVRAERVDIARLSCEPAVRLAAAELRRCLTAGGVAVRLLRRRRYCQRERTIWLGTAAALPAAPCCADAERDGIDVRITAAGGYIAGANPRSVLIGAYRYLEALGCRWVRPGRDGEIIPAGLAPLRQMRIAERASYRHRGVCIEGAVSYENVRDLVDWLPRLGFNAYFIQFRAAYTFFHRWYAHVGNPRLRPGAFSDERAARLARRLRVEIKRRGLDLHMVGHGWTCEPLGIPAQGWYQHEGPLPPETRQHLAQVGGQRQLWGGVALNTNLCYGNPATRRIMVDAIVEYAGANPDVDMLHVWLADGANNHCECPLCAPHRPADLYVQLLNELDASLTAAGLRTRIVFLIYVDLLWPPLAQRLAHPERFVLMFAPITRSYSTPFATAATTAAATRLPPFRRNRLRFPRQPAANLAFLRSWRRVFAGDGFDFDYHLMWDHYRDPGQMAVTQVLHEDIQRLRDIGLDGLISCQVQRAFFPTSLPMVVMGRTLWDRELALEPLVAEHLAAAYGRDAAAVRAFLQRVTELFDPPLLRGERVPAAPAQPVATLALLANEVKAMRGRCRRRARLERRPAVRRSWQYLERFVELCELLAAALGARYAAAPDAKAKAWALFAWVRRMEPELQPVLDVFEFQQVLAPLLGLGREELDDRP